MRHDLPVAGTPSSGGAPTPHQDTEGPSVAFARSGLTVSWNPDDGCEDPPDLRPGDGGGWLAPLRLAVFSCAVLEVGDLRPVRLFDGLSDDQLAQLAAEGTAELVEVGVELFHQGDPADAWWVLVDGAVDLRRHVGQEDIAVGRMDQPGRWAGGFRAWDEQGVYLATGVGAASGRVLRVPATALRRLTDTWFPFGGHLIEGLFTTARSVEATARQRETLVTLGRLAADLAHELNNPAAAAIRAVDAVESASRTLAASLERLGAAGVTAEQLTALESLRRQVTAPAVTLDPLALADHEETLAAWLDAHDVADSWNLAPSLVAAGVDEAWCEGVASLLGPSACEPGLEWITSSIALAALIDDLRQSTRRVSEVVAAMKSYSQMDRSAQQRVDLRDGLEDTLIVLGHKIPAGVTVTRTYDEGLPRVEAYPGELHQVWTNLIENALDAMQGIGTLSVSTRVDGRDAVVEIGDTGPGMPAAVAERAFEAFFTTKGVAGNTGLGLETARRIVEERHGGTIRIDSRPGRTVVRVRLDLRLHRPHRPG